MFSVIDYGHRWQLYLSSLISTSQACTSSATVFLLLNSVLQIQGCFTNIYRIIRSEDINGLGMVTIIKECTIY